MIRSPAGFDGGDRIKRYLDYYQPSYGVMMLSAGQFSPALLFAAGEQGVWYDPSDFSTMFQDSAGTTPVTAVEQPVGRILDKSGRGNHATQATSASRPVLSARVNQLTYSEQFDNAAWTKINVTVTPNVIAAPTGTSTADIIIPNAVNAQHRVDQTTTSAAVSHVFSVYAKNAGYNFALVRMGVNGATFNLTTATITGISPGITATCTLQGDGWCLCTISGTAALNDTVRINVVESTSTTDFIGNGTSGIYIWGADFRPTNQTTLLPAYQRIAAATDYDTTGFPYYLRFDGTDDSMATGTINPGAVDKAQVFAGVRKLSDVAIDILAEFSPSTIANNGAWSMQTVGIVPNQPAFSSRGTVRAPAFAVWGTSPLTGVLTGLGDISGDFARLRVNGSQIAQSTVDQGTGNYLSYPLYIGRRGGTSLPFNGQLYSLIARFGANLPDATIAQTETWVNGKTGAY